MKWLFAIAALLYSTQAVTEQTQTAWWQEWVFGAPCSLKTDIEEGTCILEVKRKPDWSKK